MRLITVIFLMGLFCTVSAMAQVNVPVNSVIVTDDLRATENLIGGYDQDDADDRALALHWNFGDAVFIDIHIYIEDLRNEQHHYLGRTADGTAASFEWRAGNPHLNPEYADGPQFGESYRFIVIGLMNEDTERQWLFTLDPVEFLSGENPTPTSTPNLEGVLFPSERGMVVTDTMESTEDLSGRWDQDEDDERAMVLKWDLDQNQKRDSQFQHLYLSIENEGDVFFASIEHPQNYFVWKPGDRRVVPRFRNGPQYGEEYTFKLFYNRGVSITHGKPVIFLNPNDPTPTATPTFTQTPTQTSSPTKTYTPTNTSSPTFTVAAETPAETPTATPTASQTPQPTRDPSQPPQEITIDLPGLPEGAVPLQLVWIPPGKFMMGSPEDEVGRDADEGPQHEVTISEGFYMGKYEVTNAQFTFFLNSSNVLTNKGFYNSQGSISINDDVWKTRQGDDNKPVFIWNWDHTKDFCDWLIEIEPTITGRLPSEAEWEYACRAGTTTRFSFGDVNDCENDCTYCTEYDKHMWWCGNKSFRVNRVGTKSPNPWGLFDMHGNVWEWCLDMYDGQFYLISPNQNPINEITTGSYVIRGGSWESYVSNCRSSKRNYGAYYSDWTNTIGFRVAASIKNPTN